MLFELRTYDLKPGRALAYLEHFRTLGVGLITRHLPLGGYWMTESGRLNRLEHLWIYESLAERDTRRARLAQDRVWTEDFLPRAFAEFQAQENRFLALERSSVAFDAAVANRRARHPNQCAETPMFGDGLHSLTMSSRAITGDVIAAFRIVSGAMPGGHVTLAAGNTGAQPSFEDGIATHELLRPLSLSPLR